MNKEHVQACGLHSAALIQKKRSVRLWLQFFLTCLSRIKSYQKLSFLSVLPGAAIAEATRGAGVAIRKKQKDAFSDQENQRTNRKLITSYLPGTNIYSKYSKQMQNYYSPIDTMATRCTYAVSGAYSSRARRFLRPVWAVAALLFALATSVHAQLHLSTTTGSTSSATTLTISHTTGSESNRLMLVGVSLKPEEEEDAVPTVKYGGTSLTQVGTKWGNGQRMAIFKMLNPPVGTANVVITLPEDHEGAVAGVSTFAGVDQTNPLGAFDSATGSNASPSVSIASEAGNLVFDVVAVGKNASLTVGAGQTEHWKSTSNVGEHRGGGSSKSASGSSTTMSWSLSTSKSWVIGGVAVRGVVTSVNYNNPGTFTFTVPLGVSSVTVETWGGGGYGGKREALIGLGSGAAAGRIFRPHLSGHTGPDADLQGGCGRHQQWFARG